MARLGRLQKQNHQPIQFICTGLLCEHRRKNLQGLAGTVPNPLNIDKAVDYCDQLSRTAEAMSGIPAVDTEAAKIALLLVEK